MTRFGVVVIDPVRAFTDPTGVLRRVHPPEQFTVIRDTVDRLGAFLQEHEGPKVWVRPHYKPGQFTDGDADHPLGHLCADLAGDDCQWDDKLQPPSDAAIVVKTEMDAASSPAFVATVEGMLDDVDALLITGFWLTACVAATAVSCARLLGDRVRVVVPLSLAATQTGLYDDDVPALLERLRSHGVDIELEVPC